MFVKDGRANYLGVLPASLEEAAAQVRAEIKFHAPKLAILLDEVSRLLREADQTNNCPSKLHPHAEKIMVGSGFAGKAMGLSAMEVFEGEVLGFSHDLGKRKLPALSSAEEFTKGRRVVESRKHCFQGARDLHPSEKLMASLPPQQADFINRGILHHHTPFEFLPRLPDEYHPQDRSRDIADSDQLKLAVRVGIVTGVDFVISTGESRHHGLLRTHEESMEMWDIFNGFRPENLEKYPDMHFERRWLRYDAELGSSSYRRQLREVLDATLNLNFFRSGGSNASSGPVLVVDRHRQALAARAS